MKKNKRPSQKKVFCFLWFMIMVRYLPVLRPHWPGHFLTPNQAQKIGKFYLKKYSKFQFSKN